MRWLRRIVKQIEADLGLETAEKRYAIVERDAAGRMTRLVASSASTAWRMVDLPLDTPLADLIVVGHFNAPITLAKFHGGSCHGPNPNPPLPALAERTAKP